MKLLTIKKDQIESHLNSEWIVTNGLGGYASGSIGGALLRRHHALLNAALPSPYGRTIMLNYAADEVLIGDQIFPLSHMKYDKHHYLVEFGLRNGIPFWKYEVQGVILEKTIFLVHHQNTACVSYQAIQSDSPIQIRWRPYLHFRMNEQSVDTPNQDEQYNIINRHSEYEIECPHFPKVRICNNSSLLFTLDSHFLENVFYELEAKRGYPSIGSLKSPGYFTFSLNNEEKGVFMVSTEPWEVLKAIDPLEALPIEHLRRRNILKMAGPPANDLYIAQLLLAADQFLMTPITRSQDMIRLQAVGEEVKSIIAGFPWFTDWGRDTMISLEGLTLTTGRARDAFAILHTFSYYIQKGLIPNMFPEGENHGIYNTADATLWFFHAIDRYIEITKDTEILEFLLPKLTEIIHYHLNGTHFGIHVDKEDGLLVQGIEGLALTWMDAKMGDWIVTPRRGKAVEINALWYNALKLYEDWSGKKLEITEKCYHSFNEKFWNPNLHYLYDVIEGETEKDDALRPNQLFAISLKYPVLKEIHWKSVLDKVTEELLTPVGLRTLSPAHHSYHAYYDGDLKARDSAYHQGTVWPWLIGPYVDVWMRVYPNDLKPIEDLLNNFKKQITNDCFGSIGEIFDSTAPFHARGCFAQAWSVAELLRCLIKLYKN